MKIRKKGQRLKVRSARRERKLRGTVTLGEVEAELESSGEAGVTIRGLAKKLKLMDPVIAFWALEEVKLQGNVFVKYRPAVLGHGGPVQVSVYKLLKYKTSEDGR